VEFGDLAEERTCLVEKEVFAQALEGIGDHSVLSEIKPLG
jgi:hypothetical protein